jgi:hypothetical protein
VEPSHLPPTHDPDLDPPERRPAAANRPPPVPQEYQRLVANPFLALCWLAFLVAWLRQALRLKSLPMAACVLLGLAAAGYLLQYHCLDCGATGRLFQWKAHACPSVLARRQTGRVRRFRGPNPVLQTILWTYVLAGLAIVTAAVLLALHI